MGAAFRRAFAVPNRIERRAEGDASMERLAVRAIPQAATWPRSGAPRTTESRIAWATSDPVRQSTSDSSSGRRRWSSRTTRSGSKRNALRKAAVVPPAGRAPAPAGEPVASAVPRIALAISTEPSRSAPAAPTTVAAVFIASAANDRKNRRRARRRSSSGSTGPASRAAAGPGAAEPEAARSSPLTTPPARDRVST